MTTGDDQQWAPQGGESSPNEPAAPVNRDPWAPAGGETPPPGSSAPVGRPAMPADGNPWSPPAPEPIRRPPVAASTAPAASEPVEIDRVEVEAVEATPARRGGAVGRIVAAGVAAVMLGGGAYLVVNAASAESGAESPEAAFEQAMAAVEAEDVIALAEIMEPSERDTVFEAGFDFVDELVRLEVLDPGVDLSSIAGIDLEFDGFEPRVERPGNGLAHVYVGEGTISGSIDVAALPLGPLLVDRMDADQLSFTASGEETAGPSTTPLVAVERDGRWYLSLWYTVAENVRLDVGASLPDLGLRPATIGGDSPEAAVRQMMDDAIQLDLRRIIGSLDPEEMAVLYDYAPLFLDDADRAANELLRAAADAGWSWELVDLGLSSERDGELATVRMDSIHFRADATNGGVLDLQADSDGFSLDFAVIDDFFGNEFRLSMELDDECVVMTIDEGNTPTTERLCGDELGLGTTAGLGDFGDQLDTLGIITREVDGVWYVSPMRTGLDAIVTAIEQVDPATLQELADGVIGFGLDGALGAPGFGSGLSLPGTTTADDSFLDAYDPLAGLENLDLLSDALDPSYALDFAATETEAEIAYWLEELGEVGAVRGVYATMPAAGGGEVAVTVAEVGDPTFALEVITTYAEANGLPILELANGGRGVETVDFFDDPLLVVLDGDRVIVVGVYGATIDEAYQVLDLQTGS